MDAFTNLLGDLAVLYAKFCIVIIGSALGALFAYSIVGLVRGVWTDLRCRRYARQELALIERLEAIPWMESWNVPAEQRFQGLG